VVISKEMVIHLLKIKLTNLGCPPSSHVIDREINTNVAYGKGKLPSFSMLIVKCSVASPMLKHCAWHGKRMMNILW
jgi:hypothetical protein